MTTSIRIPVSLYYRSLKSTSRIALSLAHQPTPRRCCNTATKKSVLVTTPIFYVNAAPHIGHVYSAVLADAYARWNRLCGHEVIYSTGTDEHGLKIQQAAEKCGILPQEFCDQVSSQFKSLFDEANISYTQFIRTTEPRHRKSVETLWQTLVERDFIYKGSYEGWYSTSDEAFLGTDQVKDVKGADGAIRKVSAESGHPVEWMQEENYMFRLSQFTPELLKWLDSGVIIPDVFANELRSRLRKGLLDLSVSRERKRLQWGIPVPGDDSQTIYVWLDALVNYLTVAGYPDDVSRWPASLHVVGKDIMTFHAVYWPAFLMAAGLEPPARILCHSHWLTDGVKMSKSLGNVVDPHHCMKQYGVDGLRYYLLRDGVPHSDGNFRHQRVVECLNAELCNNLGNLLSRCTGKAINPQQIFPEFNGEVFEHIAREEDKDMWGKLCHLPDAVNREFESLHIYRAIDEILAQLRSTNEFVQHHQPWELKKDSNKAAYLEVVLHVTMQTLRVTGILLQPMIPNIAKQLLDRLNIPLDERAISNAKGSCSGGDSLGCDSGVLYKRLKTT